MSKLLSVAVFAASLFIATTQTPNTTSAQTCTSVECGSPIQFTPGQRIRVDVINTTSSIVELQKIYGSDPIPLRPGQEIRLNQGDGTEPNISLLFWDVTGLSLRAVVSRSDARTLRVELRPGGRIEDRSIYILNDGRVRVF